ncbi:MAG: CoA ester lyase [Chloroflexi bacterium]|nr:CoA ester lyase [Chloroflexota bacterium]
MPTVPRSLLFVPGNRPDMLDKVVRAPADALMPDMEDAVPWGEKTVARRGIAEKLELLAGSGIPVIPRLNSLDTGLFDEDLEAVMGPWIAGVSVGKVRSAGDVRQIASAITASESRNGLQPGSIDLYPWIETARAVVAAYEICNASPRIAAVCFGAEDYSNDTGIPKDMGDWRSSGSVAETGDPETVGANAISRALGYARSAIVAGAVAAGVGAIDTPYVAFRDHDGLAREVEMARSIGFDGKFAIHPAQLDVINNGFTPDDEEIANATRIVDAAAVAEKQGIGATSLDGKMIDRPTIVRARALLARIA